MTYSTANFLQKLGSTIAEPSIWCKEPIPLFGKKGMFSSLTWPRWFKSSPEYKKKQIKYFSQMGGNK